PGRHRRLFRRRGVIYRAYAPGPGGFTKITQSCRPVPAVSPWCTSWSCLPRSAALLRGALGPGNRGGTKDEAVGDREVIEERAHDARGVGQVRTQVHAVRERESDRPGDGQG